MRTLSFHHAECGSCRGQSVLGLWNFATDLVEEIQDEGHFVRTLPRAGRLDNGEALAVRMQVKVVERANVDKVYKLAKRPQLGLARNESVPGTRVRYHHKLALLRATK